MVGVGWGGEGSTRGEMRPIATSSTTNPTWTGTGLYPVRRGYRAVTDGLQHGTVVSVTSCGFHIQDPHRPRLQRSLSHLIA